MPIAEATEERRSGAVRWAVLALLIVVVALVVWFVFFTERGKHLRDDPHQFRHDFRSWVDRHSIAAPAAFVIIYVAAGLCLLPVWWLQVLAGYVFGFWWGILWSMLGATTSSGTAALVSRVVVGEWFHSKVEAKRAKLREIDERLGHNGFLVVMATRLMHFVPFGPANYLFGLTRISLTDVLLGTLLGNIPAIAFYAAMGSGMHPWNNWRFMAALAAVNVVLLVPVAIRYWRPDWFKKIGIE